MNYKTLLILIIIIIFSFASFLNSQPLNERYKHLGELMVHEFNSAPFPHAERKNGHFYNNQTYSFSEHYNDSSVAIFIPNGFSQTSAVNFVLYFHGWNNNIDSACAQFELIEQFSGSNLNAVFVFPEGPKNAPDSFGGRLEAKDGLIKLIDDVCKYLIENRKIKSAEIGNIILAGHSGAFRVISFCLMRGGLTSKISDVILFDALYGFSEKYVHWIENFNGRFINIYTDEGGTKYQSENLIDDFDAWNIPYFKTEELNLTESDLLKNRIIFIHTDLEHYDVISKRKQFLNYLKSSSLEKISK